MILLKTDDGKYIIQSRWDNRNLQVLESGEVVFANYNQELWEKFDVECHDDGTVFFISCHTGNSLQCDRNGKVRCANQNREKWEAWCIIDPETTEMMTSDQLVVPIAAAAAGLVLVPIVGCIAGALVPAAMSTLGLVIPGVGTKHASLKARGTAAMLQATSAVATTRNAAAVGGTIGAMVGILATIPK